MVSGWYRRSPSHVPAPPGQPELIQVPGEGFGPGSHPTTTMCLAGMAHLPRLPALDAGCGSGLLAQAWAQLSGRHVLACDPDPAAVAQTRCSVAAAGLERRISVVQALVETIASDRVLGRVILANMPSAGHHALIERLTQAPPGVVASGIHRADAAPVIDAYRTLGMRVVRAARRGRWHCWTMVRQ
jgi:ribosomal protein L11 methyltransferase